MAELLKGAEVAAALNERLRQEVAALQERGVRPCLALVRAGERADDVYYEKNAVRRCEKAGVGVRLFTLPETASTGQVLEVIEKINADADIHGCLVFRPLPPGIDDAAVRDALCAHPGVRSVIERWDRLDVALLGIGHEVVVDSGFYLFLIAQQPTTEVVRHALRVKPTVERVAQHRLHAAVRGHQDEAVVCGEDI